MTEDPQDIGELERLLAAALDDRLSEPDGARLEQLLHDHAGDAESYVEMAVLHALLRWEHAPALGVSTPQERKSDECGMMNDELRAKGTSPATLPSLHPSSFLVQHLTALAGSAKFSYLVALVLLGAGFAGRRVADRHRSRIGGSGGRRRPGRWHAGVEPVP